MLVRTYRRTYRRSDFLIKYFIFFKRINIESLHAETPSTEKMGFFFSLAQSCEGKVCCYFISFTEFQNISKQRKCWNGYIKGMTTLNFSSKYQNIKGIICRCGVICVNCVNRDAVLSKQWLENISMIKWLGVIQVDKAQTGGLHDLKF